jgi:hypothetical protein
LSISLEEMQLPKKWVEWDRSDLNAPGYVQKYGSPSILVNGKDFCGITEEISGPSCRIYLDDEGTTSGVPNKKNLQEAIQKALEKEAPAQNFRHGSIQGNTFS